MYKLLAGYTLCLFCYVYFPVHDLLYMMYFFNIKTFSTLYKFACVAAGLVTRDPIRYIRLCATQAIVVIARGATIFKLSFWVI